MDAGKRASPFATLAEAAEYLRVPLNTVRWFIAQRRIASAKIGRRRLIKWTDLLAFAGEKSDGASGA